MYRKPDGPSRPDKKPIATWVDGHYYCLDCAPEAELLGLEVAPCFDDREIPGGEGCHTGCGRWKLAESVPVLGKGECRHCGCFGEDPCTSPQQIETAKKPAGRKRKASASE